MPELHFAYFSEVKQRKIEWLWYPYIPYGKITVLQGDPGEGKSTFILNIAALLTKGAKMPDGSGGGKPQTVVYQCAEDDIADTIKPRLVVAGADCEKIAYIIDDNNELTFEDARIEQVLQKTDARLLVIDPMQAFLVQDSDMQNAARMRGALGKLADVAAKHQCAVVLVGHLNKAYGGKNLYRGLGSIDIAAIARSVLMISRDGTDPSIRYMFPVKASLAPEGNAIGFTFSEGQFQWIGKCDIDSSTLEDSVFARNEKLEQAKAYLIRILKEGALPSTQIRKMVENLDISKRTIETAKKEVGIVAFRKENAWYWRLPDEFTSEATLNE